MIQKVPKTSGTEIRRPEAAVEMLTETLRSGRKNTVKVTTPGQAEKTGQPAEEATEMPTGIPVWMMIWMILTMKKIWR